MLTVVEADSAVAIPDALLRLRKQNLIEGVVKYVRLHRRRLFCFIIR